MMSKMMIKVLSFCLLIILLSAACTKKTGESEIVRPVYLLKVVEPGDSIERSFSGIAQSAKDIKLSFRIGGTLEEKRVKVGTKVRKGELIASLDSVDAQLRVKQEKALLAQALAKSEHASAEYKRTLALYETDNASKSTLDNALALYLSSNAGVEAARKSLELAQQYLSYCFLRAPVSGTIAMVSVEDYQTIAAGQEIVLLSTTDDALEVVLGIPEQLITDIELDIEASIVFDAMPRKVFRARVTEIGIETTETTTYPITLELLEKDPNIRPGMVCDVKFLFSNAGEQYIIVPPYSVVGGPDGRNYVWLYDSESQKVNQVEVTVGSLTKDGIQVLDGLRSGDVIVTKGVHNIQEDMKVVPIE